MFIELVDVLRFPNAHEESSLVLATGRMADRDVIEGVLGCPVCQAEFPITASVARFDGGHPRRTRTVAPDENEALRLAALLNLVEPRGYAILVGETASHAARLREVTDVQLLLVDPPPGIEMGHGLSALTTDASSPVIPLAGGSARAIAFDDMPRPSELEARLRVVSAGGRVLAPVTVAPPEGLTELARDERHWLAERDRALRSAGIVSIDRRK